MEEVSNVLGPVIIPPQNQTSEAQTENKVEKPKKKISPIAILISCFILIVTILAIGTFFYINSSKTNNQIKKTKVVLSSPTITPTPKPNVEWKTYISSSSGFEIDYPSNLKFKSDSNSIDEVMISKPRSELAYDNWLELIINRPKMNTLNKSLKEIANEEGKLLYAYDPGDVIDISLDKENAVDAPGPEDKRVIYAIHNNKIYSIFYSSDDQDPQYSNIVNQILSTFKFVDVTIPKSEKDKVIEDLEAENSYYRIDSVNIVNDYANFSRRDIYGGGDIGYAKKINSKWTLLLFTQDTLSCSTVKKYNIPIELYSSCY